MKVHTLQEKIAAYSAMAAAILAMPKDVDAQIIYTDVNPDLVIHNGFFNLDLNNDGVVDFKLTHNEVVGNNFGTYEDQNICMNSNGALVDNSYWAPTPIYSGDTIGPNQAFINSPLLHQAWFTAQYIYTSVHSTVTTWNTFGYFGGINQYIGLNLNLNGHNYFGWARLDVSNNGITLKDYAINLTPDSLILAGETGTACSIPAVTSIPSGQQWLCNSDSISVQLFYQNGLTVQWMKNGQWLNGETDSTLSINQIGNYEALISDTSSGCVLIKNVMQLDTISIIKYHSDPSCEEANGHANVSIVGGNTPFTYFWNNGSTSQYAYGLSAGTYWVSATSSNGCIYQSSDIVILNYGTPPDTPTITEQNNILYSSFSDYNNWYLNSTSNLVASNQDFITPPGDGIYYVEVIDTNGCSTISNGFYFHYNFIQENNFLTLQIAIENKKISFHLNNNSFLEDEIEIFNELGQQVATTKIENENPEIDLSNVPTGIYFYHIRSKQKYFSGKFFIE